MLESRGLALTDWSERTLLELLNGEGSDAKTLACVEWAFWPSGRFYGAYRFIL